jgi:RNA polymerase sigma-B factor
MLVHLISRPLIHVSHLPRSAVSFIAEGLRAAGSEVIEDVWELPSNDMDTALTAGALELRERWSARPPDVVHTFGIVAAMVAIKAGGSAPIVATFDEMPANARLEQQLSELVESVLPLSQAERERWRRHGLQTVSAGAFILPMPIPDHDAFARPAGDVVILSTDGSLDALVASMPQWGPARLVVAARLSTARLTGLRRVAEGLGVLDRIDYRPGLRGPDRQAMWDGAAVLVAGVDGSRHGGYVLEAAVHGIPSIAVAQDAHVDLVVHGTTGLLVENTIASHGLGQAVASVVSDSFWLRALGMSASVRVRALHAPDLVGPRLAATYEEAIASRLTRVDLRDLPRQCVGCVAACSRCPEPAASGAESRNSLALEHLPLARQLARWYSGRGQSPEDLFQVASLGLVRAAGRFDPEHGKEFHSFAIPTILGELRRHFRDHAWAVRVPRTLQETTLHVQRATEELRQSLGHDATLADLADELGLVEEEILLAQRADGEARSSYSLDHPIGDDATVADLVGEFDPSLDLVELRSDVRGVLGRLPEREQKILLLRFYGERTQTEIAERLGISQVHVSRVLSRTLAVMRDHVLYDVPLPRSWQPAQQPAMIPTPRRGS